jgi:uncharacterized membrane protein YkoI
MNRAVVILASAFWASSAMAMEMTQVPPHVAEAATHYAPGAKFDSAGTDYDTRLMQPEYEIKGKTANGKAVEVDVSATGELHEVETEITAADVPAPVLKILKAYLPNFRPTKIEMSARPNNTNYYEFEGKVDGREVDIEISAAGNEITIADDLAI